MRLSKPARVSIWLWNDHALPLWREARVILLKTVVIMGERVLLLSVDFPIFSFRLGDIVFTRSFSLCSVKPHIGIRADSMLFWFKTHIPSLRDIGNRHSYTSLNHQEERGEATDLLLDDHDEEKPYLGTPIASRAHCGILHLFKRTITRFHFILPSFLLPKFYEPKKLRSTAWLGTSNTSIISGLLIVLLWVTDFVSPDGLRGVAAFLVVLHHASLLWFSWEIHKGWGAKSTANNWLAILIRLPIIRLLISGLPHVSIFFVISGYAISHKPLSLARQGRYSEVSTTLSSAIFRRHARLFLPAAVITLCTAVTAQFNDNWFVESGLGSAVPARVILTKPTLSEQLWDWVGIELQHTKPLRHGFAQALDGDAFNNVYDYNLWTLPIEFTSSMVVFLIIAAFSRLRSRARMVFVFAALIYVEYYFVLWAIFLFLAGMLMCDLRLELDGTAASSSSSPRPAIEDSGSESGPQDANESILPLWARQRHGNLKLPPVMNEVLRSTSISHVLGTVAFTVALWLLATPDATMGARESWTYAWMTSALSKPYDDHVFVPLGAVLLVFTVDHAEFLQGLFTNRVAQYLGRVSYSLYLVHGPLLWSLGIKIGGYTLGITGWGTPWQYCVGVLLGIFLWLVVVIYIADFTARYIDEQCVMFTKWVYDKLANPAKNELPGWPARREVIQLERTG